MKIKYYLYISFLFIIACSSAPKTYPPSTQKSLNQAKLQGFSEKPQQTNTFLLTTYEKLLNPSSANYHVYIEGDGNSWKTRYRLSNNPTPLQPLALHLAMRDPFENVIYIARPCQYTPLNLDKHCDAKYWSSHRYAKEVISSVSEVLDNYAVLNQHTNFTLIGFSGGASVAALVAAQRNDIQGLITVAGDLNHERLNRFHKTTPLSGSLNPTKMADKLKDIPQQHYVGENDPIIPTWLAQGFAKELNNPACVKVSSFKGVSHHKGWENKWPELINQPLACSK